MPVFEAGRAAPYGPPGFLSRHADGGQNLLCKSDNKAAKDAEDALRPLAGVVGLDRHTQLDDAPAQDHHADGLDAGENKVAEVVDNGEGVAVRGKSGDSQGHAEGSGQGGGEIKAPDLSGPALVQGIGGLDVPFHKSIVLSFTHKFQSRPGS